MAKIKAYEKHKLSTEYLNELSYSLLWVLCPCRSSEKFTKDEINNQIGHSQIVHSVLSQWVKIIYEISVSETVKESE